MKTYILYVKHTQQFEKQNEIFLAKQIPIY